MSKTQFGLLQTLSILMGVMIGSILTYFYNIIIGLPMVTTTEFDVWNMVMFMTIPALAGFVAGLIEKTKATANGLFSGLFAGMFNLFISIYLMAIRGREEVFTYNAGAFVFFLTLSLFLWMVIGAMSGRLAKEYE